MQSPGFQKKSNKKQEFYTTASTPIFSAPIIVEFFIFLCSPRWLLKGSLQQSCGAFVMTKKNGVNCFAMDTPQVEAWQSGTDIL